MPISKEDLKLIEKSFDKQVKKAVELIQEANKRQEQEERNYFKDTERLLYNYPALKQKIDADVEFLNNPDAEAKPSCKSKDIVCFSTSNTGSHGLDLDRYTQGVKSSMMRTRQEVLRIERALESIKGDTYYRVIELKYFDGLSFEEIAEGLEKDEKTCRRNRSRLVNKLKIMLFGVEAI